MCSWRTAAPTFLWEGRQDTSFTEGIRNALVRRATLYLWETPHANIANKRCCNDLSLPSTKGDDRSRLLHPLVYARVEHQQESSELRGGYSPSPSLWGCHRLVHSFAEAQGSSSLAVSRQPFCLQVQSPHLFSPRRSLLLAPGYYTVPLGFPMPCSTLEIIPFLKLINLTVLSVSCQGLIYA